MRRDRTTQVIRASRALLWTARLAPPSVAVLATATVLGRLCARYYPDGLDVCLRLVRESFAAS